MNHLKKALVFILVFTLITEIESFTQLLRNIRDNAFSENNITSFIFKMLENIYIFIKTYSMSYILILTTLYILLNIYFIIKDKTDIRKKEKINSFESSLYRYLHEKPNGKGYLITGEWGSGKSYIITKFIEKFYMYSNKPIFRISCYGLDSRELVLSEIKNQIELYDNSLINWMQYIPIIGLPIYRLFKETYSLKSIPSKSIFIFEDFERITLGKGNSNNGKIYHKSGFLLNNRSYQPNQIEDKFDEIKKEFSRVEEAFTKLDERENSNAIMKNLQKYNSIVGLINELIENYKIKVLIVCNINVLGYNFTDNVFRDKLDCITYNKSVNIKSLHSICNDLLINQIYEDPKVKEFVSETMKFIIDDFEKVWFARNQINLRQIRSVFQALLDTIEIYYKEIGFNRDYISSLFYSIYIIRILRDDKNLVDLDRFEIGANLGFLLKLYKKFDLYELLLKSIYFDKIKWVGLEIAGFWILNMSKTEDIQTFVMKYNEYEYTNLDLTLLRREGFDWQDDKMLLEHILYVINQKSITRPDNQDKMIDEFNNKFLLNFGGFFTNFLSNSTSIEDKVYYFIINMNEMLKNGYQNLIIKDWFLAIYNCSKVKAVKNDKNYYLLNEYNEYTKMFHN